MRQRRPLDLDVLVELLKSPDSQQSAVRKAVLLKAFSRLPADALSGNEPKQLGLVRELRQAAAKKLVAQAEEVLNRPNVVDSERVAAIANLSLDSFDNQQVALAKLFSEA